MPIGEGQLQSTPSAYTGLCFTDPQIVVSCKFEQFSHSSGDIESLNHQEILHISIIKAHYISQLSADIPHQQYCTKFNAHWGNVAAISVMFQSVIERVRKSEIFKYRSDFSWTTVDFQKLTDPVIPKILLQWQTVYWRVFIHRTLPRKGITYGWMANMIWFFRI